MPVAEREVKILFSSQIVSSLAVKSVIVSIFAETFSVPLRKKVSLPVPPVSMSLPAPPNKVSLPAPPSRESFPLYP